MVILDVIATDNKKGRKCRLKKIIFGMGVKLNPKRSHEKNHYYMHVIRSFFMIKGNCWVVFLIYFTLYLKI